MVLEIGIGQDNHVLFVNTACISTLTVSAVTASSAQSFVGDLR
jgi:hypothetical protein